MKLPNFTQAIISKDKIEKYLLNLGHSDGASKAKFFINYGFDINNPDLLKQSLMLHCKEYEIKETSKNDFGIKYVIDGEFETPDKRKPLVRTVWFIENLEEKPQFVTAYPIKL